MRSRRGVVLAALAVTAGVLATACSSTSAATGSGGDQVVAVGAENEYANVIGQIGGKYVQVTAIRATPTPTRTRSRRARASPTGVSTASSWCRTASATTPS